MPDPSDVINGTTDIFDDSNLRIIIKLEGDIEEESAGSSSRHGQPLTESQTSESRTSVSQQDSGRFSDKDATDKVRHGQPSTEPQKTGASRSGPQLPSTCKACSSLPSPCQVCSALPASDAQSIASAGTDEYIINGRRMYIVGGPIAGRRHAAILLIHDLRGWRYPALRAIAQVLAKTLGVTVWVPDFFNNESGPGEGGNWDKPRIDGPGFLARNSVSKRYPEIKRVAKFMNSVFENQYVGVLGYSWGGLAALRLGSDAKEATVDAVVAVHPHVDPDTKQAYPDPMLVPTQVIVGPKGSSAFGQALGHDGGPLPFANPYAYRGYCEHFCLDKHATYDFGLNTKDGDIHAKMRVKRARDNVVYFFRMFLNLGGVLTLPEDVRDSRKDMMELKYDLHDPCGQGSLMKLAEELKAQFPHKKEDIDRYVADVARDEMMELLQL